MSIHNIFTTGKGAFIILFVPFLAVFLTACASPPTAEELANADYGSYMSRESCVTLVEQHIKAKLIDPYSAVFSHNQCYKGASPLFRGFEGGNTFGYLQTGTVNAKNAFGGYTGNSTYRAVLKNGQVLGSCIDEKRCY